VSVRATAVAWPRGDRGRSPRGGACESRRRSGRRPSRRARARRRARSRAARDTTPCRARRPAARARSRESTSRTRGRAKRRARARSRGRGSCAPRLPARSQDERDEAADRPDRPGKRASSLAQSGRRRGRRWRHAERAPREEPPWPEGALARERRAAPVSGGAALVERRPAAIALTRCRVVAGEIFAAERTANLERGLHENAGRLLAVRRHARRRRVQSPRDASISRSRSRDSGRRPGSSSRRRGGLLTPSVAEQCDGVRRGRDRRRREHRRDEHLRPAGSRSGRRSRCCRSQRNAGIVVGGAPGNTPPRLRT